MVQRRRMEAAAASAGPFAEKDASDSDPEVRVTHDAKLPAELFLAIVKLLADRKDLKTLLELTLGNKALAEFGRPILKAYPRRTIWLALQAQNIDPDGSGFSIIGAYSEQIQAQRELEDINDWLLTDFDHDEEELDLYGTPDEFEDPQGTEKVWIEKHLVLGNLEVGHVWVRSWEFKGPCICGSGGALGRVYGVSATEHEARKGFEDEIDNEEDYCDEDGDWECGLGTWGHRYRRLKVLGAKQD